MKFWRRENEERGPTAETVSVPVSRDNFLALFGVNSATLPAVTIDNALSLTSVWAATNFLSRTLASLPLHSYRNSREGPQKLTGTTANTVHRFANEEMDTYKFRFFFWFQVFTGGRGLAWIERRGDQVVNLWPLDPRDVRIVRKGMQLEYVVGETTYPSNEILDVPFALKSNQTEHYGPIMMAAKAIQLSLAMNDYSANFFAGGGVPPLALTGPLPSGPDGMARAMTDMDRSISASKSSSKPVFMVPPGHELKAVGFDPAKGQMVEAKRLQTEEIARAYQLPPVFLQDLTNATFSNAEQQDLHLVKHLVGQWAKALEGEMTLKIFGRTPTRYVEHNLDGLLRGDLKSRMEGLAQAIMTGQMTPNEARELSNRAAHENAAANELYMQGATVALGTNEAGQNTGDNDV